MFAIVETGGKQYKVQEKDVLRIEKLDIEAGKTGAFDKILLVSKGADTQIGTPFLKGATVDFKVLSQGRGEKIRIFKMKAKKRYKKTQGHRQNYTEVEVTKISA